MSFRKWFVHFRFSTHWNIFIIFTQASNGPVERIQSLPLKRVFPLIISAMMQPTDQMSTGRNKEEENTSEKPRKQNMSQSDLTSARYSANGEGGIYMPEQSSSLLVCCLCWGILVEWHNPTEGMNLLELLSVLHPILELPFLQSEKPHCLLKKHTYILRKSVELQWQHIFVMLAD